MRMLLIPLLCLSCTGSKKSAVNLEGDAQETSRMVLFEKQGCRGYCPMYTLELFDNGKLKFLGERNTALTGEAERMLSEAEMAAVQKMLDGSTFYELDELYDNNIVDVPFHTLEVVWNSNQKKVRSRGDKPGAYQEMEVMLERLANKEHWLSKPEKEKPRELIIELRDPDQVALLEEKYLDFELTFKKRVSPRQLYFLFDVNNVTWDREEILEIIKNDPDVKSVQWNRQIQRRDR